MKSKFLRRIHKYQKLTFLCVVFFNSLHSAFAQDNLAGKPTVLREKLFVHTDKTFYLSGEIIWFKIYDIDGIINQPLDFSRIAYVELINPHGKAVLQIKVGLEQAAAAGSLFVPTSLVSGNYILRAYTSWMKNFDPACYFEQPVMIVNSTKGSTVDTTLPAKKYDIRFFPEGGNLVDGLQSKVAFRIVDQFNNPIECKGVLINQKKDSVLSFKTLRFGAGQFSFTVKKGEKYQAILKLKDTNILISLPDPLANGYVMRLEEAAAGQIKVSVEANLVAEITDLYLLTESHQVKKDFQIGRLSNNKASFFIDKNKLGDGISCITLFDAGKNPVAERLYFRRPARALKLEIGTDKKIYSSRDKVSVALSSNERGANLNNMSMSVYQVNPITSDNFQDILSYIYLTSELKGTIIDPGYYFSCADADLQEATENLMMTQGWGRFKFSETKENHPQSIAELEGTIISGKLIDKKTAGMGKNILGYLTIPGKKFQFATSRSDSSGNIVFNCPVFYGHHQIILQTDYFTDSNYRIDLASPFSEQFSETYTAPFTLSKAWQDELLRRSIYVQIENNYPTDEKNSFLPLEIKDTLPFYGVAGRRYLLDDYTRFPTMEEVMREYVEDVMVRMNQGNFTFRAWNSTFGSYFDGSPLVLIDGLPIFDVNKMIAFDPLKIKKIEIVPRKYYYGPSINEGIISYSTYNGDLAGFPIDPNSIVVDYQGLQQRREFYAPRYDTEDQKASRLPDFRNVLYWTPDIKMDSTGKASLNFYSSDDRGKYIIVVEGISTNGLAGSATAVFDVSEQGK